MLGSQIALLASSASAEQAASKPVAEAAPSTVAPRVSLQLEAPAVSHASNVTEVRAETRTRARSPNRLRPPGLDLMASTWVPLSAGPELTAELPGRVLLSAHVGWMPGIYSRTLTDALADAGAYDPAVGSLIDGALDSAVTWRLAAGWRPFERAGLELSVGYAYVSLDGSTNTAEVEPVVSEEIAERLREEIGDTNVTLTSSIHNVMLSVGWRWLIADQVVVRANLGYMQAFASDSSLDIESSEELTELAAPYVDSVLHANYTRYIRVPVVGLGVGYRFF